MRSSFRKPAILALVFTGLIGLSCLIVFTPSYYPGAKSTTACVAPALTHLRKSHSFTIIRTECRVSSEPYDQVREWYHTEPIGVMSLLPGFPNWQVGSIRFSIYETLDIPPTARITEFSSDRTGQIVVVTRTFYSFSW